MQWHKHFGIPWIRNHCWKRDRCNHGQSCLDKVHRNHHFYHFPYCTIPLSHTIHVLSRVFWCMVATHFHPWDIRRHMNRFCALYPCQRNNYCNCCIRMFAFGLKTCVIDRWEIPCKYSILPTLSNDHTLKKRTLNQTYYEFEKSLPVATSNFRLPGGLDSKLSISWLLTWKIVKNEKSFIFNRLITVMMEILLE